MVQKLNEKKTKFVQVSDEEDEDDVQEDSSESISDDEHTWKDYKKELSDIQKEKKK